MGVDADGAGLPGVERAEVQQGPASLPEDVLQRPVGDTLDRGGAALGGAPPGGLGGLVGLAADLLGPVQGPLGVDQDEHGVGRQVVGQGLELVEQQRQQRLDALDVQALGDLGEQVAGHRDLGGELAGPAALGLAQPHLPARPGLDRGQLGQGPLAGHGEGPDALDLVAPQLDPDRVVLAGREEVDQAAPDGDLAPALDHVGAGVAGRDQPLQQLLEVDPVAGGHGHRLDHVQPGGEWLHHRPGGHGQQAQARSVGGAGAAPPNPPGQIGLAEPVEQAQAGGHRLRAGRQPLVGQGLPGREGGGRVRAQEGGNVGGQGLGVGGGGGGHDHQPPGGLGQPGHHERPGHVGHDHLGPRPTPVVGDGGEQVGEARVVGPAVEQGIQMHASSQPLQRDRRGRGSTEAPTGSNPGA